MMYPILCKVQYESLHHVFRERAIWIQILFSILINWIVAPFFMVTPLFLPRYHLANPPSSPSPGPSSPTNPASAKA
jgi:ACR3 family arsenite efflux pump ArsB